MRSTENLNMSARCRRFPFGDLSNVHTVIYTALLICIATTLFILYGRLSARIAPNHHHGIYISEMSLKGKDGAQEYAEKDRSCQKLLSEGRFQHDPLTWRPAGCRMHNYTAIDARRCVTSRGRPIYIVFMGDSRIRELFYTFADLFTADYKERKKLHHHIKFQDDMLNMKLHFLWMPAVNHVQLQQLESWLAMNNSERADLIITSVAIYTQQFSTSPSEASKEALRQYKENITHIVPLIDKLKTSTKVIWRLQDPVEEDQLHGYRARFTNDRINRYNQGAMESLQHSAAEIWSSTRLVFQGCDNPTRDGIHLARLPLHWDSQILFNMFCNKFMGFNKEVCCSR
ncbi:N-acetylneuraminate 9-O-acetyltransferase-like [Lineus longissimus]|uniref:N-acetylneuraminate 9-O-acetyltransferase-like n=1 Tax=Lineus longissimus TaxID=88925 RepID=UPI002B4E230E